MFFVMLKFLLLSLVPLERCMNTSVPPPHWLMSWTDIRERESGKILWDAKHENLSNEIDRIKKENRNMQIELNHLKREDITSLNYKELMALEPLKMDLLVSVKKLWKCMGCSRKISIFWRMKIKNSIFFYNGFN